MLEVCDAKYNHTILQTRKMGDSDIINSRRTVDRRRFSPRRGGRRHYGRRRSRPRKGRYSSSSHWRGKGATDTTTTTTTTTFAVVFTAPWLCQRPIIAHHHPYDPQSRYSRARNRIARAVRYGSSKPPWAAIQRVADLEGNRSRTAGVALPQAAPVASITSGVCGPHRGKHCATQSAVCGHHCCWWCTRSRTNSA